MTLAQSYRQSVDRAIGQRNAHSLAADAYAGLDGAHGRLIAPSWVQTSAPANSAAVAFGRDRA